MAREVVGRTPSSNAAVQRGLEKRSSGQKPKGLKMRVRPDRRSQNYLHAVSKLDAGVHGAQVDRDELAESIGHEFPGFDDLLPIGIVSQCFLGHPYEVHTLDCVANHIVEHYERGRPMPDGLERVRKLAMHPSYLFIEVYDDRTVAVLQDGSIVDLDGT